MKSSYSTVLIALLVSSCTSMQEHASNLTVRELSPEEARSVTEGPSVTMADHIKATDAASKLRKGMSRREVESIVGKFDDHAPIITTVDTTVKAEGVVTKEVNSGGLRLRFAAGADGNDALDSWGFLPVAK